MKSLIAFALTLSSAIAFAGSNDLRCRDAKGDVEINMWNVSIKSQNLKDVSYYSDSSAQLFPGDLVSFLNETGTKVIINADTVVKTIREKHMKDECRNAGFQTETSEDVVITDTKGNVLKKAAIKCVYRHFDGDCA